MNFNRKNHHRSLGALSACLIAIFSLNSSVLAQDIWYVDGSVEECDNLGNSWPNAFKFLQDALDAADGDNFDEIWVAATISTNPYRTDDDCLNPNGTGDRTTTFQLEKGVFLLGGFDGTELFDYERDPILNVTVLTGDVATIPPTGSGDCYVANGTPGCDEGDCENRVCAADENCCDVLWDGFCATLALVLCGEAFHVVTAGSDIDDPEFTVIDGFTIRDGTANGPGLFEEEGGGMLIKGEPSVVRCLFTENTALTRGGGMSINGEFIRPHIINSVFDDNPGDQPLFVKSGAGLANFQADPSFVNCLFRDNVADQHGGAIHNSVGECANPPSGPQCGRITLVNCTVYGNDAGTGWEGGGLYNNGNGSICDIDSSIFWANLPDQIAGVVAQSTVDYTDVQGGSPIGGTDNINLNPAFVNEPDDLRLTLGSDAIDVGNPLESVIPCDFFNLDNDDYTCAPDPEEATPDLDLFNRVLDGDLMGGSRVDMGSYEFVHPDSCPWDINGDEMVGAADLLFLLANWGPCSDCNDCPADFNDDCDVGASDLLALLANWGPCPERSEEPLSLEEELALHCLDLADWAIFEDKMQNGTEAEKENHLCWMLHYLEDCSKCFCVGASGCPGADPYN